MENIKLYCLIYELKGMISSLSELGNYEENYNLPIVETIEVKMNQIINVIEEKSA